MPPALRLSRAFARTRRPLTGAGRPYSSAHAPPPPPPNAKQPSRHAVFYQDMVPGMLSVGLLGSAIYLGLRLLRANLAQERFLDEAQVKVRALEGDIATLQAELKRAQEQEQENDTAAEPPARKRGWFS